MRYLPPILALLALFLILVALMVWGWRRRAARQRAGVDGRPLPAPEDHGASSKAFSYGPDDAFEGTYVATTLAGRPLDRVTAYGLGSRSRASVVLGNAGAGDIWYVSRQTARSFAIPVSAIRDFHTAPGMVGKWIGGDGLLVITWQLGETLLDTGFRLDDPAVQARVLARGPEPSPQERPRPPAQATVPTPDDPDPSMSVPASLPRKEHP